MSGHTARSFRHALLLGVLGCPLSLAGDIKPAPNFTLDARGGKTLELSQLRGQVVMLNFWASWCGPCKQEMPLLEDIYKKYSKMGFTLLGVNVEPDTKNAESVLKSIPVSFPILFDRENRVSTLYTVSGMPTSVLIDRKGNVRYLHRGYKAGDENTYLNYIRTLIKE